MNKDKMIKWLDNQIYYEKAILKEKWLVKGAVLTKIQKDIVKESLENIEMLEEIRKLIQLADDIVSEPKLVESEKLYLKHTPIKLKEYKDE